MGLCALYSDGTVAHRSDHEALFQHQIQQEIAGAFGNATAARATDRTTENRLLRQHFARTAHAADAHQRQHRPAAPAAQGRERREEAPLGDRIQHQPAAETHRPVARLQQNGERRAGATGGTDRNRPAGAQHRRLVPVQHQKQGNLLQAAHRARTPAHVCGRRHARKDRDEPHFERRQIHARPRFHPRGNTMRR